jgi:hypothetical protein
MSTKIADRPHAWTIAISVFSLVVSIVSFLQARNAARISATTSRAVMQASALKLPSAPENMSFLVIDLTLTNYGQARARKVATSFEWDVSDFGVPMATPNYLHPEHADFPPKSSRVVRLQANRRFVGGAGLSGGSGLKGAKSKLIINGVTYYTDEATGMRDRDVWCFLYDPHDEAQAASHELRPCEYQP